jgi:uncharacterized membrane protein YccC
VLVSATPALLLAFILPVTLPGPASTIPDRLAGWGMAGGAAVLAVVVLWPAPARDRLRDSVTGACRALAARLRAHTALAAGSGSREDYDAARAASDAATTALAHSFFATPYRPTGLTTSTRVLVRVVDEIAWLGGVVLLSTGDQRSAPTPIDPSVYAVKSAAAAVLEAAAELLERPGGDGERLTESLSALTERLGMMEHAATVELPPACAKGRERSAELVSALDPTFRAQELAFVTSQIGANIEIVAAAERRGWIARLLGHRPQARSASLTTAHDRAASHADRDSVWLHNSLRGAIALGLAVLIASLTGASHSFWVVLGTLSVLRSNAFATGQNALRGLAGTVCGFAIGAALIALIGSDTTVLWLLLAPAVLLAGFAPAAISFAAGQAAFTVTLVILYNLIEPAGWRVGLIRVEDVALGCAISLVVGLLFWPRGAAAAFGSALGRAYADGAQFLQAAVAFGMGRCDKGMPARDAPVAEAARSAASARRLDDTFRTYLAERSAKALPLAEVTGLVTGVAGLRLAAEAILELWQRDDGSGGDRAAARRELVSGSEIVAAWYRRLGASLAGADEVPEAQDRASLDEGPLLGALERDLAGEDHRASATAVRIIWTEDHLDAARRLEAALVSPARRAAERRAAAPPGFPGSGLVYRLLGVGPRPEPVEA